MRKLIVTIISTLDGYAAGEGGDVFAMPIDLDFDHYNLSRVRETETLLFGAQTFRAARVYWPQPRQQLRGPRGGAPDFSAVQHAQEGRHLRHPQA